MYFAGRVATYEEQLPQLIDLKQKYNIDVFCSINGSLDDYHREFLKQLDVKGSYFEEYTFDKDWLQFQRDTELITYKMGSAFYNNARAFEQISLYQEKHGFVYDAVIKYRADVVAPETLELPDVIQHHTVYIPHPTESDFQISEYPAVNDQIAIGDYESMKVYSNVHSNIQRFCEHGLPFHPETLLCHQLSEFNISIVRFDFKYVLHSKRWLHRASNDFHKIL